MPSFGSLVSAGPTSAPVVDSKGETRPAGWGEGTHSNDVEPNYEVVFPRNAVNEFRITIASEDWAAMGADMTTLMGARGSQRGGPGGFGGGPQGGGGFRGGMDMTPVNPIWVPATIEFNGVTWTNVGVRYKGNSSLRSSWASGTYKLPLKFDFDEFEGAHTEINNQRFYGFKQLSFANGFGDETFMRERVMYSLLEQAALVASKTAYYNVTLDYGEGEKDLGLYTAIEVTDDTVVPRIFGDDEGNIYEGDGSAAGFAEGTFDQIEASFQKENNEDEADWNDIEKLYNVLHAGERTPNPEAWRAELEAVFDVDAFLRWLALSALMQHWDTYGAMTHNYYLYHDAATDKLEWISWDHNLVLGASPRGFGGPGGFGGNPPPGGFQNGGFGGRMNVTFDKNNVGTTWPLIRFLLDDPNYHAKYIGELRDLTENVFDADALAAEYQALAEWIGPYAIKGSSQSVFDTAVQQLTDVTKQRAAAAQEFLAENK